MLANRIAALRLRRTVRCFAKGQINKKRHCSSKLQIFFSLLFIFNFLTFYSCRNLCNLCVVAKEVFPTHDRQEQKCPELWQPVS